MLCLFPYQFVSFPSTLCARGQKGASAASLRPSLRQPTKCAHPWVPVSCVCTEVCSEPPGIHRHQHTSFAAPLPAVFGSQPQLPAFGQGLFLQSHEAHPSRSRSCCLPLTSLHLGPFPLVSALPTLNLTAKANIRGRGSGLPRVSSDPFSP